LEIQHVEATDAPLGHAVVSYVAVISADLLVTARAEGIGALPAQDDHSDVRVVPGHGEGIGELEQRLRSEGVPSLRATDGQLGDPLAHLESNVAE